MKFFTPELYRQFNSPRDRDADRANEAWEAATRAYLRHLDGLREQMLPSVRKLAELCLHDAEVLAWDLETEPFLPLQEALRSSPSGSTAALVALRHGEKFIALTYFLWDRIRQHPAPRRWPFSKRRKHWLYDELDLAETGRGRFLHRVLLSDGSVLEIPFLSVIVHSFPLPATDHDSVTKRTA